MSEDKKGPETDAATSTAVPGGTATPANDAGSVAPGAPAAADAAAMEAEPPPDAAQLEAIIRALQDQIAVQTDTNLRLRAEMENLRKRFEREKADTAKYAISKFAQDVVNVGDNFQRAISAVPAGAAETDAALKSFLDGVLLAEREFINVLERHGVVRLDPRGEPFNPKIHNAVMEQENRNVPAGTVLQVFQAGYMIEDRCLKPALVVVSRGGSKLAKAEAQGGEPRSAPDNGASPGEPSGSGGQRRAANGANDHANGDGSA